MTHRSVTKLNSSVFATINRFPGLFAKHPHIEYNPQTTFAMVSHGHEHEFVSECKRRKIVFMTYPPQYKL